MMQSVLNKETFTQMLSQYSTDELEKLVTQFPYFHQAHLLLAKKYQQENNPRFDAQLQLAALYTQDRDFFYSLFSPLTKFETSAIVYETPLIAEPETKKEVQIEPEEKLVLVEPVLTEPDNTKIESEEEVFATPQNFEETTAVVETKIQVIEEDEFQTYDDWLKKFSSQEVKSVDIQSVSETNQQLVKEVNQPDKELNDLIQSNLPSQVLQDLVTDETHYSKGLDQFIAEQIQKHKPAEATVVQKEKQLSDDLITETMAKVYEMQKKYSKALHAYEVLSLKYPEKSDLFAARINFLKNQI